MLVCFRQRLLLLTVHVALFSRLLNVLLLTRRPIPHRHQRLCFPVARMNLCACFAPWQSSSAGSGRYLPSSMLHVWLQLLGAGKSRYRHCFVRWCFPYSRERRSRLAGCCRDGHHGLSPLAALHVDGFSTVLQVGQSLLGLHVSQSSATRPASSSPPNAVHDTSCSGRLLCLLLPSGQEP